MNNGSVKESVSPQTCDTDFLAYIVINYYVYF